MINFRILLSDTKEEDICFYSDKGFPLAYVGRGTYSTNIHLITYHSIDISEKVHLLYFGRYSSIGDNLKIYCDINHDHKSIYMGVILDYSENYDNSTRRERIGQIEKRMHRKGMTIIGNDVWIGNDVSIISDVVIGNGAVIGAGSVIRKDVPPYTIWCGNPAICIGKRFPDELISGFQKISWWNFSREKLKEIEHDMKGEASDFVSKFKSQAVICTEMPRIPSINPDLPVMITFIDIETDYSVFCDITDQFCNTFNDKSTNLIICYYKDIENDVKVADSISDMIFELSRNANIILYGINSDEDEYVISIADYLILGRDIRNIQRINYAFKYDVKLISGVDIPMFSKNIIK